MMPEKYVIPPKTENDRFTDDQWRAIHQSGNNLLVAASAGSGKTTVLVERVIEKIKNGTNVDELLVVTFTNAAAREMKEWIQAAIQQAVNEERDLEKRWHLIAQMPLLPHANISTLHSLCLHDNRREYYLLHVDPGVRSFAEETEEMEHNEDGLDEVREERYGKETDAFYPLAEYLSNDAKDNGLTELIF